MALKRTFILLLMMVFPVMVFASEPEPEGEPSSVNVLGETEEQSQEVTVRAMTLREILLQRLRERHAVGLDMDIPESFIENLSDEAIEEIFRQADEEDTASDILAGDGVEKQREEFNVTEEPEKQSWLDYIKEWITAAAMTLFGGATVWMAQRGFAYDGDEEYGEGDTPEDSNISMDLEGNINAEMIWHFLKAEGFTDEGAAGVMGNIRQEAGPDFDPKAIQYGDDIDFEDEKQGVGIMQWSTKKRKLGLIGKAVEMGLPWFDLTVQLAYMKEEAATRPDYVVESQCSKEDAGQYCDVCYRYDGISPWNACKTCTNYIDATYLWHDNYVLSEDYTNSDTNFSIANRLEAAQKSLSYFAHN